MTVTQEEQFVTGLGWTADINVNGGVLHVDPAGDNLVTAVQALVAPWRRRLATVQWIMEDEHGWDVYELSFDPATTQVAPVRPLLTVIR